MIGQYSVQEDINKLIRLYFDAKEDYRLSCNRAPDDGVRDEMKAKIDRREQMHMQMQQALSVLGAEMSDNGTVAADFKRDWERLRGSVAGHGFEASLKLADQSDASALEKAEHLLKQTMPDNLRALIDDHAGELRSSQARTQELLAAKV